MNNTEKSLDRKVFLLTGASRGIGAASAMELIKRGAVVIGPHRDPGKNARAEEVERIAEQLGGKLFAPLADVTQKEQRARLFQQIKQEFGLMDGIIFNHAGGMEKDLMDSDPEYHLKVNGYSKLDLFQEADNGAVLKDKVILIDIPSLWSKFQHTEIEQLPQYGPVAEGKKLGEQLLRKAVRAFNAAHLKDGKEVKFGSVCGNAVGGTTTIKLLSRIDKEAMVNVERNAPGGKLPEITDMAQAVAGMAEGNFRNEDIIFVGTPQIKEEEMSNLLSMYSEKTCYIDHLISFDNVRSFGFYKVSDKDILNHFSFEDGVIKHKGVVQSLLTVAESHTQGHFTPEFNISVFPGHKIVAACAETAFVNLVFDSSLDGTQSRISKIEGPVEFKIPVIPGDELSFEVQNPDEALDEGARVSVKIGKIEVANAGGIKFMERNFKNLDSMSPDPDSIGADRFIEAAAQSLGVGFLKSRDIKDVLPLFGGFKSAEFFNDVYPGQLLEMETVLFSSEGTKQFSGDITFRVDDEIVAKVLGINCRLFPTKGLGRVIRMGRRVLGSGRIY